VSNKEEMIIEIQLGRVATLLLAVFLLMFFFLPRKAEAQQKKMEQDSVRKPLTYLGSYYLTENYFNGATAYTACALGYRMATLWELLDPSNLDYNLSLGYDHSPGDQGSGPPSGEQGWVRTGGVPSIGTGAGNGNCGAWSFSVADQYGSTAWLPNDWSTPSNKIGIWLTGDQECNARQRVWCYHPAYVLYLPFIIR